jgi:hypothetical protein
MIDFSDLQGVVNDFAESVPLVVNRPGLVTVPSGSTRPVSGDLVPVTGVVGSCWPVSGKSLELLDGIGQRLTEAIDVFTPFDELMLADDETKQPGDQITWHDKIYEVIVRHDWIRGPLWHYIARKVRS